MKIIEKRVRSILNRTKIPGVDYVVNPYVGCQHNCVYCYARYVRRFIGEDSEWGDFVYVKVNGPELAERNSRGKCGKVAFSTVCDAYQPLESKYKITRGILENLNPRLELGILTKSPLVLRDIDVLKRYDDVEIGLSIMTLDEDVRRCFELNSPSVESRIDALRKIHEEGIRTFVFIAPIMPYLTDMEEIMKELSPYVDFFQFEDLNLSPVKKQVLEVIDENFGDDLLLKYKNLPKNFWDEKIEEIIRLGKKYDKPVKIFFKRLNYFHYSDSK
ncbi:MAG: radical SAM protein [Nanoarchaeota archaeon]